MTFVCLFVCIPNYYLMVQCNDIHLAKACQYAVLSLVGPSSLFGIVSHIGRDKLVIRAIPDLGAPCLIESLALLSLEQKILSLRIIYIGE